MMIGRLQVKAGACVWNTDGRDMKGERSIPRMQQAAKNAAFVAPSSNFICLSRLCQTLPFVEAMSFFVIDLGE